MKKGETGTIDERRRTAMETLDYEEHTKKMRDKQKLIIKIITQVTTEGWWQPYGEYEEKGSHYVIEEKEPFFWRINPKWSKEIAEKILKELEAMNNVSK